MKFFAAVLSVLASLMIEWAWLGKIEAGGVVFPLAALVILGWFWELDLTPRLWLAVFAGIFLDTLYPVPFGTHTLLLILLAVWAQFLQNFFSDPRSLFIKGLALGILLFLFINLLTFAAALVEFLQGEKFLIDFGTVGRIFLASLLWSAALPFLDGGFEYAFRRLKA